MATLIPIGLPLANERGERLLAFHRGSLARASGPIAFALVLASRRERILLVNNRRRRIWELPGGWRDAGESAHDCAVRELREESGCDARTLSAVGWVELETTVAKGRGASLGAIFSARIECDPSPDASDEIAAAAFWSVDALPLDTSAIDAWLIATVIGMR